MKSKRIPTVASWLVAFPILAAANNPNTDWFLKAGYGIFVHYLEDLQNDPQQVHSLGRHTSWDACVREFDVNRFAEAMAEAGAGYVVFTMHQRTRFLIAPNATFDRLTGYKPGEACATRDLVEDLYQALHPRHIPLMLYWTGDGPRQDPQAAAAMGATPRVSTDYVKQWASVVQEYGERYGEKVAGWWADGCYPFIGFPTQLRISVSADRKDWRVVASAQNLDGQPFASEFTPVPAQYVRISAIKPDGPNQPGAQMAVDELEAYQ